MSQKAVGCKRKNFKKEHLSSEKGKNSLGREGFGDELKLRLGQSNC